ncbi:MAG: AraC family transcriptional regulator [Bacteroidota bacterium]
MEGAVLILVLSCLGIAQALFLCIYLFTLKKGNRYANFFLGLLILGLTIRIGKSILNEYLDLVAWQRNLGLAGILLVGPSLWYHGKVLFGATTRFYPKQYLHFLPYLCFTFFCWLIPNRYDTLSIWIYYGIFFHLLCYLILSAGVVIHMDKKSHSAVQSWYRNLVIGVGVIWVFYMGNILGLIPFYIGGALCYTLLVYIFSFLLLQKHSFQLVKYSASVLDQEVLGTLSETIQKLFQEDTVYLNPQITLNEVASAVGSTPKIVSQVINTTTGKNFSEYVNAHRVEKAKTLLRSPAAQKEKIASIAYDSGFNNVTSFNTAFKAMTGQTPSEFRKHIKIDSKNR